MQRDCPLSIIVTVYQKEAHIGYVIAGIVENTTSPFELVVVYDGCTDRSEQVVNSVLAANKGLMQKLTVVHTPDINEVRANNAGMRAAGGDYWILLQDDMQVTERGWEKRLLYPILQWPDVFAVSANKAHSFYCTPAPVEASIIPARRRRSGMSFRFATPSIAVPWPFAPMR